MLRSLHVKNYILIDSLEIEFPEGLVIVTGQTGAGKSILLGALSLLSGARAEASMISPGADSCVVEAEFEVSDDSLAELMEAEDIDYDGGRLLVRRTVSSSGRSRSFVNDCPVQVGFLQTISSRLVDIHSQHKSLLLSDKAFQLSVLDYFAGNAEYLRECRRLWRDLQGAVSELADLKDRMRRVEADREYNETQLSRLEAAGLAAGELADLEEEHKRLANAEQIGESLGGALQVLSPEGDFRGVSGSVKEAVRLLGHIASCLPSVSPLCERLESSRMEIEDVVSEISGLYEGAEVSPERLSQVEDRLSMLYSLLKKHGCATVEELIGVRDSYRSMLVDSSELEERIAALEKREASLRAEWSAVCDTLSASRKAAAPGFASSVSESLRFLELDRAAFEVALEPASGGPSGADRVSFLFSSTGRSPMDVSKVASGGEISRIMLCLKAMMARFVGMPTLIFDEIDTGVSGSVADRMGQMICEMGRHMQVFSITHLPQVAAKGDAHYVVSKSVGSEGRTVSSIRRVDGRERVGEIARLLSGATVTAAAMANAEALLKEGR